MTVKQHPVKLLAGALAVVCVVGLAPRVEAGGRGPRPGTTTNSKRPKGKYPYLGNPKAKVVIEVFGDFQCPFTRRLAPTLPKIAQAFPKKVKIIWRDFPLRFHRRAMPAAMVGREVFRQRGTQAFLIYGRLVFSNYRNLTDANLVSYAVKAGANRAKVQAVLRNGTHRTTIANEMKKAKSRPVRGTPTILINGIPHKGGRTLAHFRTVINAL